MKKPTLALIHFLFLLLPALSLAATGLQTFEADSFARILEKQKGKAFVLVVWSLDCEFCQVSLKTLASEKVKHKGLSVVTISTDDADDPQSATLMQKRLSDLRMSDNAWAFGSAPPERLRYVIDPQWHGEMPRSYWFNARGEKVAYSGVLTPATIGKLSLQMQK
ncbi:MAG: redoxin domain-containing protein [Burkholderiales bacterium]|nr:redoxin domain-containing protein [Burkholderiales bacterium]